MSLSHYPTQGREESGVLQYSHIAILYIREIFPKAVKPGVRRVYVIGLLHRSLDGAGRLAWTVSVFWEAGNSETQEPLLCVLATIPASPANMLMVWHL